MSSFERYGALSVSLSSTLSFVTTLALGTFITYLTIRYRRIATEDTPTTSGIRFLRSQAGYLFINLLIADFIQAFGFGLTWIWYSSSQPNGGIDESNKACVIQGLAIEAGDVASAVFSLFIAIHTAAFLAFQYRPHKNVVNVICMLAWVFVVLMTAIGPLAIEKPAKGEFYATAGNWCWIAKPYEDERLWLHYLFIFASAIGQLVAYCAVFIILRFRLTMPRRVQYRISDQDTKLASTPRTYRSAPSTSSSPQYQRPTTSSSVLRRKIDKTSLVMLAYPLVNLSVILPLSVYRLSALAGRNGSSQALAACGAIFALGGFANVLLYSFTRKLLRFPSNGDKFGKEHPATPLTITVIGNEKPRSQFGGGSPESDITAVASRPSSPFSSLAASRLKELRLSPSPPPSAGLPRPTSSAGKGSITLPGQALLPAANIGSVGRRSTMGRLASPIKNLALVNISRETITRIDSE